MQPQPLFEWRKRLSSLFLPFPLGWLLPASLHTGETKASGVVPKAELGPCLINDSHLCQSIHSAVTARNESHLAGRWADPQSSLESMTSDKHASLADHQTHTRPRSENPNNAPFKQAEVKYSTRLNKINCMITVNILCCIFKMLPPKQQRN